mmetsp:Transcript_31915/g.63282  ORF Transcript_31915/g.63282 Transcript_31915/m.63282 type:complete len:205 (-) Transcript_31915:282-896(-)
MSPSRLPVMTSRGAVAMASGALRSDIFLLTATSFTQARATSAERFLEGATEPVQMFQRESGSQASGGISPRRWRQRRPSRTRDMRASPVHTGTASSRLRPTSSLLSWAVLLFPKSTTPVSRAFWILFLPEDEISAPSIILSFTASARLLSSRISSNKATSFTSPRRSLGTESSRSMAVRTSPHFPSLQSDASGVNDPGRPTEDS